MELEENWTGTGNDLYNNWEIQSNDLGLELSGRELRTSDVLTPVLGMMVLESNDLLGIMFLETYEIIVVERNSEETSDLGMIVLGIRIWCKLKNISSVFYV